MTRVGPFVDDDNPDASAAAWMGDTASLMSHMGGPSTPIHEGAPVGGSGRARGAIAEKLECDIQSVKATQGRIEKALQPLVALQACSPPEDLWKILGELAELRSTQCRIEGLLTAAGQPRDNDAMRQEARELRRQVSRSIDHISALQRESLAAAHDAQLGVSQLVAYIDLRDHDSLSSTAAHGRGERAESVRSSEVDLVKTENALLVSGRYARSSSRSDSHASKERGPSDASSSEVALNNITFLLRDGDSSIEESERNQSTERWEEDMDTDSTPPVFVPETLVHGARRKTERQESDLYVLPDTLPPSWPEGLALRPCMDGEGLEVEPSDSQGQQQWRRARSGSRRRSQRLSSTIMPKHRSDALLLVLRRYLPAGAVIHPASQLHLAVHIFNLLVLLVDLSATPYILAWEVPYAGILIVWAWMTVTLWTLDIIVNFVSGFTKNGEVILKSREVAIHYLRSWFFLDLALVGTDWASTIIAAMTDGASSTKSLRLLRLAKLSRIFRVIGLLRVFRLARIAEDLLGMFVPDGAMDIVKIFSILLFVLWINHMIGCCFFFIGRQFPTDTGTHWLQNELVVGATSHEYDELATFYQYTTAFHWAMAQTTLGAVEIVPSNTWERVANIFLLLFGLLFSSALVSSLSALLIGFQMAASTRTEEMKKLRTFLRQNNVDSLIGIAVTKQAESRLRRSEMLQDKDVPALKLISATLFTEMLYSMFKRHLITHPIFRLWDSMDTKVLRKFCSEALSQIFKASHDDVFSAGRPSQEAFYLVSGGVDYTQSPDSSVVQCKSVVGVTAGTWLCEAALWTCWIHVGDAETISPSHLLRIDAEGMVRTFSNHRVVMELTSEYGRHFHKRVVAAKPPHTFWPTDLEVPFTEYDDIVPGMSAPARLIIGRDAMSHLPARTIFQWSAGDMNMEEVLEDELSNGMSTLLINKEGEAERVVSLVLIRIERYDQIFVKVGLVRGTRREVEVKLPGGKLRASELPGERADLILAEKLWPIAEHIAIVASSRNEEHKQSKRFTVKTKYIQTIFQARVKEGFDLPVVEVKDLESIESERYFHGHHFATRPLFAMQDEDHIALYTWLKEDEFSCWQSGEVDKLIHAWISSAELQSGAVRPASRRRTLTRGASTFGRAASAANLHHKNPSPLARAASSMAFARGSSGMDAASAE